ncbi:MAG: hypothetical protein HYR72_19055 [Deltaproteobacteria bacterium]|nr:hypothetical protein [Deltaproteobacteria bacterium]MBI3386180.1 hypothetical protein [Deltaproteobacteria bacterium]
MNPDVIKGLEDDIRAVHARFMAAMEQRLPAMQVETKERYFVVLTSLVGKLETPEKNLRDILQEVMSEAASLIFEEMSGG